MIDIEYISDLEEYKQQYEKLLDFVRYSYLRMQASGGDRDLFKAASDLIIECDQLKERIEG